MPGLIPSREGLLPQRHGLRPSRGCASVVQNCRHCLSGGLAESLLVGYPAMTIQYRDEAPTVCSGGLALVEADFFRDNSDWVFRECSRGLEIESGPCLSPNETTVYRDIYFGFGRSNFIPSVGVGDYTILQMFISCNAIFMQFRFYANYASLDCSAEIIGQMQPIPGTSTSISSELVPTCLYPAGNITRSVASLNFTISAP